MKSIRMVAGVLAGLLILGGPGVSAASPASSSAPSVAAATESSEPLSEAATASGQVAVSRTAMRDLQRFFAAAAANDRAIAAVAARINAAIGPEWVNFSPSLWNAALATRPDAVKAAIPAGMPKPLERAVLLVYSDLVSRSAALTGGDPCLQSQPIPRSELDPLCFKQGHEAKVKFRGDVAKAKAVARRYSKIVVAAPRSRAAASLAVKEAAIEVGNRGCVSAGGFRATKSFTVIWYPKPVYLESGGRYDGDVHYGRVTPGPGMQFRADWTNRGWDVGLNVC